MWDEKPKKLQKDAKIFLKSTKDSPDDRNTGKKNKERCPDDKEWPRTTRNDPDDKECSRVTRNDARTTRNDCNRKNKKRKATIKPMWDENQKKAKRCKNIFKNTKDSPDDRNTEKKQGTMPGWQGTTPDDKEWPGWQGTSRTTRNDGRTTRNNCNRKNKKRKTTIKPMWDENQKICKKTQTHF